MVATYPPTRSGDPATLSVAYAHDGGGRRRAVATGALVATAVHYRWFAETVRRNRGDRPDPLTALAGETGPTLRLASARRAGGFCSRGGGFGLYGYAVDVCNTAGCTRSAVVPPAVGE